MGGVERGATDGTVGGKEQRKEARPGRFRPGKQRFGLRQALGDEPPASRYLPSEKRFLEPDPEYREAGEGLMMKSTWRLI